MDALQTLDTLQERGATLQIDGEALRVAPSRVLDNDLRAAIRRNKSELLELLALESASRSGPARDVFLREVEAQKAPCGLVVVSSRLCALWRAAETECGHALDLAGNRREASNRIATNIIESEMQNV